MEIVWVHQINKFKWREMFQIGLIVTHLVISIKKIRDQMMVSLETFKVFTKFKRDNLKAKKSKIINIQNTNKIQIICLVVRTEMVMIVTMNCNVVEVILIKREHHHR